MERVPSIDGLRGVAVAAVVAYHFFPATLPGGFVGVDVFFVLSGYLLTSLLVVEVSTTSRFDVRAFVARRVRRLLPAMLLLLAATAVYAATLAASAELERLRQEGVATAFYFANWLFVFNDTEYADVVIGASPLRHVWSLAIEEQFYVLFAIGAVVATARARHPETFRRRVGVAAVVLASASAVWMTALAVNDVDIDRIYFGTDTRVFGLLIGVALGAAMAGRTVTPSRTLSMSTMLAVIVVVAIATRGDQDAGWMYRGGFVVVSVATAVLIVGAPATALLRDVLSNRVLTGLGAISYGLYLWHWPLLVVLTPDRLGVDGNARLGLIAVIALGVSVLSHQFVEMPIRERRVQWFVPLGAVGSTLIVLVGLGVATRAPAGADTARLDVSVPIEAPRDATDPAAPAGPTSTPLRADGPASSTAPAAGSSPTDAPPEPGSTVDAVSRPVSVVMLGDSVLFSLIGGELTGLFQFNEWAPNDSTFDTDMVDIRNLTRPGCSFFDGDLALPDPSGRLAPVSLDRWCGEWQDDLGPLLATPDSADALVVMLTNDVAAHFVDDQLIEFGDAGFERLFRSFLDGIHAQSSAVEAPLVMVVPPPRLDASLTELMWDRESTYRTMVESYASDFDDVVVIDLGIGVCPQSDCFDPTSGFDPAWRYDGLHFSAPGAAWAAAWLAPQLVDAVSR